MKKNNTQDNDIYEILSKNIKKYRKERHLTQAQLAEKSEYSHEFIRRIEAPNSKKNFSLDAVNNIAKALEVKIDLLFKSPEEDDDNK